MLCNRLATGGAEGAWSAGEMANQSPEGQKTGLKPLNDFRLKAVLRREGSPTQTSPSAYRLHPEACEGLQARE